MIISRFTVFVKTDVDRREKLCIHPDSLLPNGKGFVPLKCNCVLRGRYIIIRKNRIGYSKTTLVICKIKIFTTVQNKILYTGYIPQQKTCNYTDEIEYLVQDGIKENCTNVQ